MHGAITKASYTSVIAAYAKDPALWQTAVAKLRNLPTGLPPNVFTYGAAISAVARASEARLIDATTFLTTGQMQVN